MPYPGQDSSGIPLDFHPAAPAVPLLATPEFPVHEFQRDRHAGGQPGKKCDERLPVGFPRREVFQHYQDCSRFIAGGQFIANRRANPELRSSSNIRKFMYAKALARIMDKARSITSVRLACSVHAVVSLSEVCSAF